MSDIDTSPSALARRQRRLVIAGTAAAAIAAIAVVAGLAVSGDDEPSVAARDDTVAPSPITPGGSTSGSCVEVYELETLADREVAFAGTVTAMSGDRATFDVERWFHGGDDDEVTLAGASGLGGLASAGGPELEVGTRLLVAGDGGFAWACGFTQPYDDAVADEWARVFG